MAGGGVSKEELGHILLQAKCASKTIRHNRDLLLHFHLRLQQQPDDAAAAGPLDVDELVSGLVDVYYKGLEAGARYLTTCLTMAAENGARLALNPAFAAMPDEQLYDALLAQRLPARPTTQTEAFSRVEAAFYAVKLPQEHLLRLCIEHLLKVGKSKSLVKATGDPSAAASAPAATGDPAAAASAPASPGEPTAAADTGELSQAVSGETSLFSSGSGDRRRRQARHRRALAQAQAPATAASKPGGSKKQARHRRAPAAAASMEQARSYLDRACTMASLAVKHVDLAAAAISRFLDPKDVASISEMADRLRKMFSTGSETTPLQRDEGQEKGSLWRMGG